MGQLGLMRFMVLWLWLVGVGPIRGLVRIEERREMIVGL